MPDKELLIQSFQYGLDTRRSELTSKPGSLVQCENGHINQGAQIEKRKMFGRLTLPAGTFGCDATLNGLVVYGSGTTPSGLAAWPAFNTTWVSNNTVPLSYLRLQAPSAFDTSAMTAVIWSTLFGGLPFVIASFASGNVYVFQATASGYQVVTDFYAGLVLSGYTTTADQAAQLAALINQTTSYTATTSGSTVIISGTNGNNYAVTDVDTTAAGTIAVVQQNVAVPPTQATAPIASLTVSACNPGTGTTARIPASSIEAFPVTGGGGVVLNNTDIIATNDPTSMAIAIATAINAYTSTSGYSALANGPTVQIYAPIGASLNNSTLAVTTQNSSNNDGAICLASCVFTFNIGTGAMTVSNIASAAFGNIDTTSRASGSFGSVNAWLVQIAKDIMGTTSNFGAVAVNNQLFISYFSQTNLFVPDTITITYTASGGATVGGVATLSAVANPTQVSSGQIVTVTATGGTQPYKYQWTVSNPAIVMTSQSGPTNSFQTSASASAGKTGISYVTGTAVCVVTDTNNSTATVPVTIRIPIVNGQ